jgi:hypothetical protein
MPSRILIAILASLPATAAADPPDLSPPAGSVVTEDQAEATRARFSFERKAPLPGTVAGYRRRLETRGMTVEVAEPEKVDAAIDGKRIELTARAIYGRSRTEVATVVVTARPDGTVRVHTEWCQRVAPIDAAAFAAEAKLPLPDVTHGRFPAWSALELMCAGKLPAYVDQWKKRSMASNVTPLHGNGGECRADICSGFDEPPKPTLTGSGNFTPPTPPIGRELRPKDLQVSGPIARSLVSTLTSPVYCPPPADMLGKVVRAVFVISAEGSVLGVDVTGSTDTVLTGCIRRRLASPSYSRPRERDVTRVTIEWTVVRDRY